MMKIMLVIVIPKSVEALESLVHVFSSPECTPTLCLISVVASAMNVLSAECRPTLGLAGCSRVTSGLGKVTALMAKGAAAE